MTVICLYVQAPFAVFRTFTAGWYRPTSRFLTPSAAYGLLLNIAGIETRRDDGFSAMTVTQYDLPPVRIALGAIPGPRGPLPKIQTLFQQLHNYPIGLSGKERERDARGNKYNITPVRRELLTDLRAYIAVDANPDVERQIRDGLTGKSSLADQRYGLPFLGDNSFLIDRLEIRDRISEGARWYYRVQPEEEIGITPNTTRLTIWIDRQDMSKTLSALYAPSEEATIVIPENAWTEISPPSSPPISNKTSKRKGRT